MLLLFMPAKVVDHKATGTSARAHRKSLGVSIRKAATILGISKSNLLRLEKGAIRWDEERVATFNEKLR